MAIWITLPGYPEKGMEGRISVSYEGGAHPPVARLFDLEVWGPVFGMLGFQSRRPEYDRVGISLDEMLDVLWEHSPADADHFVHALGITQRNSIVDRAWERYRERHPR